MKTRTDLGEARRRMVENQIERRGVRDPAVLEAMKRVPREAFLPEGLAEFAYRDTPLPILEDQTISQPYIVASMTEALELEPGDRVLEVGTGSGYAAAVLGEIADDVYTIERHGALAEWARERLDETGYGNVRVRHGDGTRGWPEAAPFDAIVVAAGGPEPPQSLLEQLAIGGRLVIPVGSTPRLQELLRVTREGEHDYRTENLGGVRFVPLIGEEGWVESPQGELRTAPAEPEPGGVPGLIGECAERFDAIESAELGPLLERIGDARVVCIGEASHGTSEFYSMRARITRELIEQKGFTTVAAEADWPDAARIDHYVRHAHASPAEWTAFSRFPTWMWRNRDVRAFVDWLHERNAEVDPDRRAGFRGLDLYSLHTSIHRVLEYLEEVDPETADLARRRYGCLSPWETDPATYGRAVTSGRFDGCEDKVVEMLGDLLDRRLDYLRESEDGERFHDAVQNARLVANAEEYYRVMYYGGEASWNLRDTHMFETLKLLLDHRGPDARAVVWAHNSHLGDAAATEMGARGQTNVGHMCREKFGDETYLIGFGTDHGTVAAASDWDAPMEVKDVRPSHERSYERLCHDARVEAFTLALREPARDELRDELLPARLERAIGVIYRPETELASHYFQARLPHQFDEWIWFDETSAVSPIRTTELEGTPETYPFGV